MGGRRGLSRGQAASRTLGRMDLLLCFCTCPDHASAERLATALVEETARALAARGWLAPNPDSFFARNYGFQVRLTLAEEEGWSKLNNGRVAASVTPASPRGEAPRPS